ncbi:S-layer homology domain-containing protein [Paenibacillus sp. EC2-1]|uniref:S-layer homology domain-containing protein n=1 Tax=Paenibacillus sp. EC2-1 TaxID=3388665 RepID=UPI003BEEF4E1
MRKNKLIAWLLIISIVMTMFTNGMTVSYADEADTSVAPIEELTTVNNEQIEEVDTEPKEDKEPPTIKVEGIQDNQTVSSSEISFKITVTDNVYTDIIPEVAVNEDVLPAVQDQYKATLLDGENSITITAIDGAGNETTTSFTIIKKIDTVTLAKEHLDKSLAYTLDRVKAPTLGTGNGEWVIISLARANYPVPSDYYKIYYDNVVREYEALMSKNNVFSTEHSRLILGLSSIGKDITNVNGHDVRNPLADYTYVANQGINGPVYALLALDSNRYEIPDITKESVQSTRESFINLILGKELPNGGWAFFGSTIDPDITAMTMQGLTPYYHEREDVKAAVDRAIEALSKAQMKDGGYGYGSSPNSQSIAQVIIALTGLRIDPHTDDRFIKNGNSALDALLTFAVPDGGFMNTKLGAVNSMATDQGTLALVAYDRFKNGKNRLYDMTDVQSEQPELPEQPESPKDIVVTLPSGDKPDVVIPKDELDYIVPIKPEDSNKEITITIPADKNSKVSAKLPSNSSLPKIEATKGNVSVLIPAGTAVTTGDASALELLTSIHKTDSSLKDQIKPIIPEEHKLDEIVQAFTMGGKGKIEFSSFITLTFKGMSGKEAAYIQDGSAHAISKYSGDEQGLSSGKKEYAYDSGKDLIVKTKHFTDFVAYTTSVIETPGNGGGTTPKPTQYVTLSVDKHSINKGNVISAVTVEIQSGDTAWSVLKRELDKRNISYSYDWPEQYGSVYVKSIAGDGEFDHGSGSGWMYSVNGSFPSYGASSYTLSDGDRLQWRYTKNLGADLGEDPGKWEGTPGGSTSVAPGIVVDSNDKTPVIQVPKDISADYTINITQALNQKDQITINIPDVKHRVFLNLDEVKNAMPTIKVVKGKISAIIEKGTLFKSGDRKLELFTAINSQDTQLRELIKGSIKGNDQLDQIHHAFVMGNKSNQALFDKPLTFIVQGGKGQLPGFVENNKFSAIEIYDTEEQGKQAVNSTEKKAYAFVKNNDLYIRANHLTTFVTYTTSKSAVVKPVDLKDVYSDASTISSWAYSAVGEATEHGFIQGNQGKFKPKSAITRAEFTKILVSVLGLDLNTSKGITFKDVSLNDWFYPYVNAAYKEGLVVGSNSNFNPTDIITREQMAATVVRALDATPTKPSAIIKDINSVSKWARTDVETIVALELMLGSNNQFKPKDSVTKEMAAVVALKAYKYRDNSKEEDTNTSDAVHQEVKNKIRETASFLQKEVKDPVIASVGGDWTVFGLARSGVTVPDAYYARYYANVEKILKEKSGKLHSVKYTEYDRVILALTAMGKKIDNVAGYDLIKPLADYETLIKQGINGPIFALIALDSKKYEIPVVKEVKTQTTREKLIDFILNRELSSGGWALGERPDVSDPDITGMVLQALTPYYSSNPKVKVAVDRGVAWLSKTQTADGGFSSWSSTNSESIAQVIVGLTSIGINPHTDARFIKNGHSPIDALLSFAAPTGGFYHVKSGGTGNGGAKPGEVDLMATDQAFYALVAFDRFINGQSRLYDLTDVK